MKRIILAGLLLVSSTATLIAQQKTTANKTAAKQSAAAPKQKQSAGKKCTAHFGCTNNAFYEEPRGTLYCREHKPRNVPFTIIAAQSTDSKKRK